MECPKVVNRGRNFRLLTEEELPELLDFLGKHLPLSLKVCACAYTSQYIYISLLQMVDKDTSWSISSSKKRMSNVITSRRIYTQKRCTLKYRFLAVSVQENGFREHTKAMERKNKKENWNQKKKKNEKITKNVHFTRITIFLSTLVWLVCPFFVFLFLSFSFFSFFLTERCNIDVYLPLPKNITS